jgi:hypothetical protein
MALIEIDPNPSSGELRKFAALFPITCAVIGAVLYFRAHWHVAGIGVWTIGPVVALIGLARPAVVKPLYLGMRYATAPIALAVTYVMLAVLYYFVVFPVGLIMRAVRRDAMHRKFDPLASSYWIAHDSSVKAKRYFTQY